MIFEIIEWAFIIACAIFMWPLVLILAPLAILT